jgi:hypothetical protein
MPLPRIDEEECCIVLVNTTYDEAPKIMLQSGSSPSWWLWLVQPDDTERKYQQIIKEIPRKDPEQLEKNRIELAQTRRRLKARREQLIQQWETELKLKNKKNNNKDESSFFNKATPSSETIPQSGTKITKAFQGIIKRRRATSRSRNAGAAA